jgi:hypothetical protein
MYLHKSYNWDHLENFLIFFDMIGITHFSFYDSGGNPPEMYNILNAAVAAGMSIDNPSWQLREWHGWEGHQTLWGELCAHKAIVEKFQYVLTGRTVMIIRCRRIFIQHVCMYEFMYVCMYVKS